MTHISTQILTGNNVSPVTEIEAEVAFFVHLNAHDDSYFDTRDTGVAFRNAAVVATQQGLRVAIQPALQGMQAPRAPAPAPPPTTVTARAITQFYGNAYVSLFAFQHAPGLAYSPVPFQLYALPPTPFAAPAPPRYDPPTSLLAHPLVAPAPLLHMPMQLQSPLTPAWTIADESSSLFKCSPPLSARPFSPSSVKLSQPEPPRRMHASFTTGVSHVPPPENTLDLARIERGADMRTTVMIRNIPNKVCDRELLDYINEVVPHSVDFFYLRMDFQNGKSLLLF